MITASPLNLDDQHALLYHVQRIIKEAPPYIARTPGGGYFQYKMTNCGDYGWTSSSLGYGYLPTNPFNNNKPWPKMPDMIKHLAMACAHEMGYSINPESCLINIYTPGTTLGMHQDKNEKDLSAAVVSISLGCAGYFRLGNHHYGGTPETHTLMSGDIMLLAGHDRMRYHGFGGLEVGTSPLPGLEDRRINLTIRQVN